MSFLWGGSSLSIPGTLQLSKDMPGDGFEEAHQVAKEFSCGHTKLLRGYLTLLKRYHVEKVLLGLELSDDIDVSVSKLWQCVSGHTLWSLIFCWYFVWHVGLFMPWPVASMAQYLGPCAALWFLLADMCLFWFESIRFARLRFTLRFQVQWNVKFCLAFGLKPQA